MISQSHMNNERSENFESIDDAKLLMRIYT